MNKKMEDITEETKRIPLEHRFEGPRESVVPLEKFEWRGEETDKDSLRTITSSFIYAITGSLKEREKEISGNRNLRRNLIYDEAHKKRKIGEKEVSFTEALAVYVKKLTEENHYLIEQFKNGDSYQKFISYALNKDNAGTLIPLARLMMADEKSVDIIFRQALELANRGDIANVVFNQAVAKRLIELTKDSEIGNAAREATRVRADDTLNLYRNFPKEFERKYGDPKQGEIYKKLGDEAEEILEKFSKGEIDEALIRRLLLAEIKVGRSEDVPVAEPASAEPPESLPPKNRNGKDEEKGGKLDDEPKNKKDGEQQKTLEEILEYVKKLIDQLQPIQDLPATMESVSNAVKDLGDKLGLREKVGAEQARRNRERALGKFGNFIYKELPQFAGIDPLSEEYFQELRKEGAASEENREKYIRSVIGEIRETLETLENTRTTMWHVNGLTVEEQYLNSLFSRVLYPISIELEEFSIGEDSFSHIYERMSKEISGRQWLHINNLIFMRSTPGHIEDLVKGIMELREIAEVKWICKIPGFGNAWRSLERDGVEFIRFEGRPEQEDIKNRARNAAEKGEENNEALKKKDSIIYDQAQKGIWSAGMTGRAAAEIAERYHRIEGREAEWCRMYAQKYRVVYYADDRNPNDKDRFSMKHPEIDDIEQAEQAMEGEQVNRTFDPYRFSYYPHLLWQFFGVGGKTEGKYKNFIINRRTITGKTVQTQVRIKSGAGMGRAIRKTLFETGFDLPVSDWVSRRMHGYILPGWIEEQKTNNPEFWETELRKKEGETDEQHEERRLKAFCDAMKISDVDKKKLGGGLRDLLGISPDDRLKLVHGGFEDLSKYRIEDTPWDYISRQHENVRAHVRDHAVVLENLNKMFGYINYPTLKNLLSLGGLSGIADLAQVQAHFHRPLYESFEEVRRGRFLGRFSFGKGIFRIGKSIGEEVAGWETLKVSVFAKLRQVLVRGQKLPKLEADFRGTGSAIYNYLTAGADEKKREDSRVEAKEKINTALEAFYDWFQREAYDFVDPDLLLVIILGLAAGQLQQLEKDLMQA